MRDVARRIAAAKLPDALTCINLSLAKICTVRLGVPGLSPAPVGEVGMLRKMFEHYRMLRFEGWGRWQSAKATIKFFCDWYLRDWYTRFGR
jgi:hypothetical protein